MVVLETDCAPDFTLKPAEQNGFMPSVQPVPGGRAMFREPFRDWLLIDNSSQ